MPADKDHSRQRPYLFSRTHLASHFKRRSRRTSSVASSDARIASPVAHDRVSASDSNSNSNGRSPDDDTWYAIKDIVRERTEKGQLFYLVDWADHPETGASYPPWIPECDASEAAVRDWKAAKRLKKAGSRLTFRSEHRTERDAYQNRVTSLTSVPSHDDDEDVPTSHRKRKRLRQSRISPLPESRDVSATPDLIPEHAVQPGRAISIELYTRPDFDPDEYLRLSQLLSQLSSQSQSQLVDSPKSGLSQSSQFSQPEQLLQASPSPRHPLQLSASWPSLPSQYTIPDSQEDSGLSAVVPVPDQPSRESVYCQSSKSFPLVPQSQSQAFTQTTANVQFITQPDPDFDLLSSSPSSRVPAYISSSHETHSWGASTVPDSVRPLQTTSSPPSAQIAELFQSQQRVFFPGRSPKAQKSARYDDDDDGNRHKEGKGLQFLRSQTTATPSGYNAPSILRLPLTSLATSCMSSSSPSSMDDNRTSISATDVLRETHREAIELSMLDDSDTVSRMQHVDHSDMLYPSLESANLPVVDSPCMPDMAAIAGTSMDPANPTITAPIFAPEGIAPATIDTSLLMEPETVMTDVGALHGGHSLDSGHGLTDILTDPILSFSPDPSEHADDSNELEEAEHGHSSLQSQQVVDQVASPLSTGDDTQDESPSPFRSKTYEYIVTLPLAANSRQRYIDVVMDIENQSTIREFSEVFARDTTEQPSKESASRVDTILQKLTDLSDVPPFYDSLPTLSTDVMMKHAANTNSKFTFLHEFLMPIRSTSKKLLILAHHEIALDYIEAMTKHLKIPTCRLGKVSSTLEGAPEGDCRLSIVLGSTGTNIAGLPGDVDFVIGFDHTARTSGLLSPYLGKAREASEAGTMPKPIVLLLVAAYSLEHVDLRLPLHEINDLERKNALLLCTLECLPYLQDSAYDDSPVKPHEAAKLFSKLFINSVEHLEWKPIQLPEDVFDIYISSSDPAHLILSQEESTSLVNTRKRSLLEDDGERGTAKRVRTDGTYAPIVQKAATPLSDTLTVVLGGTLVANGPTVEISLVQLEALAARAANLEAQLREKEGSEKMLKERVRTLGQLAKDTAATIITCERRLFETTKDRGIFEVERDKAVKEAESVKERLANRDSTIAELRASKTSLEKKLTEARGLLAQSAVPDVVRLAAAEAEAEAAQQRVATLERKVASGETDLAHARRAYQDASNAAADLSTENRDITAKLKKAEALAAENLRIIQEAHQRSETEAYQQRFAEQQLILRERERDLERTREELRILKNGRRETRAQSVPRSPRPGVLSPRTVAGRNGINGGGSGNNGNNGHSNSTNSNGNSSSASRGNSPIANADGTGVASVPGMTYFSQPQGSGRWGHLRD